MLIEARMGLLSDEKRVHAELHHVLQADTDGGSGFDGENVTFPKIGEDAKLRARRGNPLGVADRCPFQHTTAPITRGLGRWVVTDSGRHIEFNTGLSVLIATIGLSAVRANPQHQRF